jgi:acetyltransferase-like isoleucine patch superfamily enzyme
MENEEDTMNFRKIGENVRISPFARFYSPETIEIGDNVRIDDFCILSGGVGLKIGSHIHISCHCAIIGNAGITIEDFSQVSSRVTILSGSDDFTGESLLGPCIPRKFKLKLVESPIVVKRHVIIGAGCTILPGVTIGEGVAVGAHSLVKYDLEPWFIYYGNPAKKGRERSRDMLILEKQFLKEYAEEHGA